jgi:hypothetical protein
LPVNEPYAEIADLLIPATWPPDAANNAAVGQYIQTRGMPAFQAAFSRGQHAYPRGMFFGGTAPSWSNLTLRGVLRQHGAAARRIAWIDLHTGLGPNGLGERIYAGADDAASIARARSWWGGGRDGASSATPVTSIYDGSSTSAFLTGLMWMSLSQECPRAEYTGIAMEYGTQPMEQVSYALRAEHWLDNHPEAPAALARQIKQQMLDAFYTDTDAWKGQIVSQARQAMVQAVDGLSAA